MILAFPKTVYYDVRGGAGVPVRKIGDSSFVLAYKKISNSEPPWDVVVDVNSKRIYIGKGYVNQLEPLIDGEPISGIYPDGKLSSQRPFLQFYGTQCVLLKITPNKSGEIDRSAAYLADPSSLTVEMGDLIDAQSYKPDQWIQPLAIVSDGGKVAQLSYFNYLYRASKPRGKSHWRHFLSSEPVFSRSIQDKLNAATAKEGGG